MSPGRFSLLLVLPAAILLSACAGAAPEPEPSSTPEPRPSPTTAATQVDTIWPVSPDEPVVISGTIPFTSPFFLNTISEPFVLLEDEAGFVRRDREFEFPLDGQVIGPVEMIDEQTLTYTLPLPSVPQGTLLDLDNDGQEEVGVMVFAVAYWSNTWGGPFLEPRDGRGWSNAYTSAITDPERDDEIIGGTLLVYAPDDQQGFPTGFGEDELLFTEDDPTAPIPEGYNLVDLDQDPFRFYKEPEPEITLVEGVVAVNDYADMGYEEAFQALFEKVRQEYPFTQEKGVDWESLHQSFTVRVAEARNDQDFYRAIRDFTFTIPDGHIGVSLNNNVFFEEAGGGLGLLLSELSDGHVIVTEVVPYSAADRAGIQVGAEIQSWNGEPVSEAISKVQPLFGPFSTAHRRRLDQLLFLTRMPPGRQVSLAFRNPGATLQTVELTADIEYTSLLRSIPSLSFDELALPLEGERLDESGLGYIRITTFSDDYNLMARLWETFIQNLIDNQVPGLIIDLRVNGGGNGQLALDFAGYFFERERVVSRYAYYNEVSGRFETEEPPARLEPGPLHYQGEIALLVSPYCVSACEGFAHAINLSERAFIVGEAPSAGAYGEVGQGQYKLPGGLSLQFPTGRPQAPNGELLIEGEGITPDILVPKTVDSALGRKDLVLQAAVDALQERIGP